MIRKQRVRRAASIAAVMLFANFGWAQQQHFDVASVRPSKSGDGARMGCRGVDSKFPPQVPMPPLGRCAISNARFDHLIAFAYNLHDLDSIKGGPPWIHDDKVRFTVYAAAPHPDSATAEQLQEMMKGLLAERFKAKFEVEQRQEPGYALVVSKGGSKLAAAKPEEPVGWSNSGSAIAAAQCTMQFLAGVLANRLHATVSDQTGLKGGYDFSMTIDGTDDNAWEAAVRSLGLQVVRRNVATTVITVLALSMPDEN